MTRITFGGPPSEVSKRDVRNARYDSAIWDWGRDWVTSSTASRDDATVRRFAAASRPPLEPRGIIPSDGSAEMACACSGVRTVLSMPSSRNASPMPVERPRASANIRFRGTLGSDG